MIELSPEGRARREAMRRELSALMRRRQRRRERIRRGAAAATMLALTGAIGWLAMSAPVDRTPRVATRLDRSTTAGRGAPDSSPPERAAVEIEIVRTDSSIVQRLGVPARLPSVKMLDDDELLHALAQIDRPAGLIRFAGEVRLTAAVTDAALREQDDRRRRDPTL
jgi:hypothetical protein